MKSLLALLNEIETMPADQIEEVRKNLPKLKEVQKYSKKKLEFLTDLPKDLFNLLYKMVWFDLQIHLAKCDLDRRIEEGDMSLGDDAEVQRIHDECHLMNDQHSVCAAIFLLEMKSRGFKFCSTPILLEGDKIWVVPGCNFVESVQGSVANSVTRQLDPSGKSAPPDNEIPDEDRAILDAIKKAIQAINPNLNVDADIIVLPPGSPLPPFLKNIEDFDEDENA